MPTTHDQAVAPRAAMKAPRYFEVFGDALVETIFLRNAVVLLGGISLVLCVGLVRLSFRPPLVIRVDNIGDPVAFTNTPIQNSVTAPEVRNFADHFTRYLLGWDLYTVDHDVDRALAMMTERAAQKMVHTLDAMGASTFTKGQSVRTSIELAEIVVDKETPDMVRVKLRGTRTYASYSDKELKKETTFEDTFIARKVARSAKTPWGLLVDDWQESIFKSTP